MTPDLLHALAAAVEAAERHTADHRPAEFATMAAAWEHTRACHDLARRDPGRRADYRLAMLELAALALTRAAMATDTSAPAGAPAGPPAGAPGTLEPTLPTPSAVVAAAAHRVGAPAAVLVSIDPGTEEFHARCWGRTPLWLYLSGCMAETVTAALDASPGPSGNPDRLARLLSAPTPAERQ